MSECSAVVRLQVVHPVPAFFIFSKICIPRWLYGFMLVYNEKKQYIEFIVGVDDNGRELHYFLLY